MVLEMENPLFVDRVQPYKLMGIEILSRGLTPQFTLYDLISFGKVVHVFLVREIFAPFGNVLVSDLTCSCKGS